MNLCYPFPLHRKSSPFAYSSCFQNPFFTALTHYFYSTNFYRKCRFGINERDLGRENKSVLEAVPHYLADFWRHFSEKFQISKLSGRKSEKREIPFHFFPGQEEIKF
jgi:hypothetical protein